MKTELLTLFAATPALASKPAEFLDTLAEDVQATVIRALALVTPVQATAIIASIADDELAFQNAVDDLWVSELGRTLTSLVTLADYPHKEPITAAQCTTAVKAMLGTLLLEQSLAMVDNTAHAAVLKTRLKELEKFPATVLQ